MFVVEILVLSIIRPRIICEILFSLANSGIFCNMYRISSEFLMYLAVEGNA